MSSEERVQIETREDRNRAELGNLVGLIFLLGLGFGIGWKLGGESEIGGTIGLGISFVGCMFIETFRNMILGIVFFFVGAGILVGLLSWIFS